MNEFDVWIITITSSLLICRPRANSVTILLINCKSLFTSSNSIYVFHCCFAKRLPLQSSYYNMLSGWRRYKGKLGCNNPLQDGEIPLILYSNINLSYPLSYRHDLWRFVQREPGPTLHLLIAQLDRGNIQISSKGIFTRWKQRMQWLIQSMTYGLPGGCLGCRAGHGKYRNFFGQKGRKSCPRETRNPVR